MARKFVCSYLGRVKAEVSLEGVPQEDRATKGKTLFLYPRCTKILTQVELNVIGKIDPVLKRKIHVHREIGGVRKKKVFDSKPKLAEIEKKTVNVLTDAKKTKAKVNAVKNKSS